MPTRKKRSAAAAIVKKVASRNKPLRSNAAIAYNPALDGDTIMERYVEPIGAGMAGYAATRIAGRIGYGLGASKGPNWGRHTAPLVQILLAAASTYAISRIESVQKYTLPWMIGSGVAVVQGLLQTYAPLYGFLLDDYHLGEQVPVQKKPAAKGELKDVSGDLDEPTSQAGTDQVDGEPLDSIYGGSLSSWW
jgi:hypothetical protein